jgi:hypothetical protein
LQTIENMDTLDDMNDRRIATPRSSSAARGTTPRQAEVLGCVYRNLSRRPVV